MKESLEMTTTALSDNEIIRKILDGHTGLFEILIRRYNPYLYKTGRSYNLDHETTQDLMQDTFIDAFVNLSRFEGRATFKTWIISIMLNNCYRKTHKHSYLFEEARDFNNNPVFTVPKSNDVNAIVVNKELNAVIEKALSAIPEDYRLVFSMRELSGLSVAETAEILKLSEANVKVRLNRARLMLRKEIEKTYSPEEIFEFNQVFCDRMVKRVMNSILINQKDKF